MTGQRPAGLFGLDGKSKTCRAPQRVKDQCWKVEFAFTKFDAFGNYYPSTTLRQNGSSHGSRSRYRASLSVFECSRDRSVYAARLPHWYVAAFPRDNYSHSCACARPDREAARRDASPDAPEHRLAQSSEVDHPRQTIDVQTRAG